MLPSEKIVLLQKMIRVRFFEEAVIELKEERAILGPVHTTIGQEAVDVGVCSALSTQDYIIGNHRSHGLMIGKDANLNSIMAEIFGKSTGTNGGKGGSMHVSDKGIGSLGSTGIVGSGLPIACGSGFASKFKKKKSITCVFFGDGAALEGTFHESLNFASIMKLPIIFLLINNGLAVTTKLTQTSLSEDFYRHADLYKMAGYKVNGQNVEEVYENVKLAINYINKKNGPALVEVKTIRFREHQEGVAYRKIANTNYRDNSQLRCDIKNNDPVSFFIDKLILENIVNRTKVDKMIEIEKENIQKAIKYAKDSPVPNKESAYTNIFSGDF